ncbi:TetR/AcrR family transcriptional regulator [Tropicibacter naphthalenivorans]|uniref:DNA-binding transcriptional repressor AcrR n=1 Tax=Tropicibacter naphthalenivorans TaxID=441103 RepID=A0A0P1GHK9_9RHOB|nr:TetR/AcrR family transcriptional regulator [Tropicibacter naphthalenivorans]CUH81200.1 DNA-binding transcriptional repressor AcrR [Tropicibacter naphthalenivorans]SMC97708.1 transcriptional regulator, TetR family [Tropicibacter naphthalenivorans]
MNQIALRIHHAAMRVFAEEGGTCLAVSDVARAAGLSRATIYNNLDNPSALYASVCDLISDELDHSFGLVTEGMDDPAEVISACVRLSLRRTHEEQDWGRFLARFAIVEPKVRSFWGRIPTQAIKRGVDEGRFTIPRGYSATMAATLGGTTLGGMALVLDGLRTWRQAGEEMADITLRGLGVPPDDAARIARIDLDPLPKLAVFGKH